MSRRGVFDHPLVRRGAQVSRVEVTELATPGTRFAPYLSGFYYPESFQYKTSTDSRDTGGSFAQTVVAPMFCGGTVSFDRIGMQVRWSSSPGTAPDYRFMVYELDDDTLFPASILYQGTLRTPTSTVNTWEEDTIALTTTVNWIGIGWHCTVTGGETIAVRANGTAPLAGQSVGYSAYGLSRSGTTLTQQFVLYSTAATGTTTPGAAGTFSATVPTGVLNSHLGSGVYMRVA